MKKDDEWREPIFGITSEGQLFAGVRPMDCDDASLEFACHTLCPDWMIKKAFAAILQKEVAD